MPAGRRTARFSGEGGTVTVSAQAVDEGIQVTFSGLTGLGETIESPDGARGVPALLEWLGASFSSEADGTTLVLEISEKERRLQRRTG